MPIISTLTKTHKGRNGLDNHVVSYHDTDIVVWNAECIALSTGGFGTRTTKLRMNQVSQEYELNFEVFTGTRGEKKGRWYVAFTPMTTEFPISAENFMILNRNPVPADDKVKLFSYLPLTSLASNKDVDARRSQLKYYKSLTKAQKTVVSSSYITLDQRKEYV